jgi:hypothetical protein
MIKRMIKQGRQLDESDGDEALRSQWVSCGGRGRP